MQPNLRRQEGGEVYWDEIGMLLDEGTNATAVRQGRHLGLNHVNEVFGVPPHPATMTTLPPSLYSSYEQIRPPSHTGPDINESVRMGLMRGIARGNSAAGVLVADTTSKPNITTKVNARANSGNTSADPSVSGSAGRSDEDNYDKEAKRRATVAAASRATRAKRKRELEELKQKNVRLEKERETFLNTIADLQMKVQALRETGSIDLRMENDLLRAELSEHKRFISRFKRIADGMPNSASAKRLACKQGSDTAIAQVLGLLSTSMADPSWKMGRIIGNPEIELRYQRLPHGVLAENAKRCSVRVDIPVIPCNDPSILAEIIWRTWCDEDLNKRISRHFGAVSVSVSEIKTGIEQVDNEGQTHNNQNNNSLKDKVKVFYYREETPSLKEDGQGEEQTPNDVVDTVLLLSAREKLISRSSFPQTSKYHSFPSNLDDGVSLFHQQPEKASSEFQSDSENFESIVLASTSTQHGMGLVPVTPGVHRIRSALLEGSVFRKVRGGVAMTSVFSYPSSMTETKGKHRNDVLVTNDGILNETWTKVIGEIYAIMRESMPKEIFDEYRKVRNLGGVVPPEIEKFL